MTDKINIKFGTDGWRAVIAEDFTFRKVKVVSQGVSNYLKKKTGGIKKPSVAIGYDARFLSERFAMAAAEVFALNGITTYISERIIPTPVLSHAVVDRKADLGVMVTASHNPYYYNGYKIKGPFGGSATMDIIGKIEKEVDEVAENVLKYEKSPGDLRGSDDNEIKKADFLSGYTEDMLAQVDRDVIRGFKFGLLFEPMYGASQGIFKDILEKLNASNVTEIHSTFNPSFGGINPEPIGDNLNEAVKVLKEKNCRMAICLDGDGDRIAALGEDGNYISSHHLYSIFLWYLAHVKNMKGKVIKSVNLTSTIDKICEKYDLELVTTPVGFKYIGEEIVKGGVIMGGEESGGLWAGGNLPERDGMLMGLKLLEILCSLGKTINQVLDGIYEEFGYFVFDRIDYEIDPEQKQSLKSIMEKRIPEELEKEGVSKVITVDGHKYIMEDGGWIMIRLSGTESVARVYTEGESRERTDYLQGLGKKIIDEAVVG
ncbi:MAG: phosphoglucomutase/phosphomannomutase family protein [Actinomycetota bacterium]|nr:phosphoglucomutase/phosphomannomutase family protein [Actinomycetota bacterium]